MSKSLILLIWLLSPACILYSQTEQEQKTDAISDTVTVSDIVITASKIPVSQKATPQQIDVITREEIEFSAGKSLAQILDARPGISINGAYSNPGKNKEVFIRGANSEYALILIDGMPAYDAAGVGGAFDLRLIPLQQIDRIEILKGSQSTLYGSDAIAGVINIITRQDSENDFSSDIRFQHGSLNTTEGSVVMNVREGNIASQLIYDRSFSEGLSEAKPPSDTLEFDKDGFQRNALQYNLHFTPSTAFNISPFVRYNSVEGEFDEGSFADAQNEYESSWLNPGLKMEIQKARWDVTGIYSYMETDRKFVSAFGESQFTGQTQQADLFGSYLFGSNTRLLGGIYFRDARIPGMDSSTPDISFQTSTAYLSLLIRQLQQFNLQFGYRANRHSEFGYRHTFSAAFSRTIFSGMKIFGSYNTGYKSPTLDQLFGQFGANPGLKPQTSYTVEGGIQIEESQGKYASRIAYFRRSIDDVIIYDFNTGYQNLNEQNDHGIECEFKYHISPKTTVQASYFYLDGEVTVPLGMGRDSTYHNLIRKPKHSFALTIATMPLERFRISLQGQYTGKRDDAYFDNTTFLTEMVTLDGYFLVNGHLEYKEEVRDFILFADLLNITNTDFIESAGFTTLGFHLMSGVRIGIF